MKTAIYIRVSTKTKQDTETQLQPLKEYAERNKLGVHKIYTDIGESGSKESRPQFDLMINDIRKNKIKCVMVYKLDRIGRSTQHLLKLFEEFNKRGIEFISITQNIDTTTPEGRMFLRMLMIMAEYERELIIDRVNAGITRAKKNGVKLGRPKAEINISEVLKLKENGLSFRNIATKLNISVGSVQRCIKTHPQK